MKPSGRSKCYWEIPKCDFLSIFSVDIPAWVSPLSALALHIAHCHLTPLGIWSPPGVEVGQDWKGESENSWDKDSSMGKSKAACTSKTKWGINSVLPMGRQVFSHPQFGRALSHRTVAGEDKHHISDFPFAFFPQILLLCIVVQNIPLVSWHHLCPVSHPKSLCTPTLLIGFTAWATEAAWTL